jgi:hypothetical protein
MLFGEPIHPSIIFPCALAAQSSLIHSLVIISEHIMFVSVVLPSSAALEE